MPEQLSDREAFENAFFYFVKALRVLASSASEQQERYGASDAGAAWELKRDVSEGVYLLNLPGCSLSVAQGERLSELVKALSAVEDVGFSHPSWALLRQGAVELLRLLEPVALANASYFGGVPGEI